MFILTTRTEYGVPAVLELARQQGRGLIQLRAVAERNGMPLKYLEQIFSALNKAGLVRAVRGMHGGYELARPADQITLWDVLQVLEGRTRTAKTQSPRHGVLRELCRQAESRMAAVFNVTLTEVLRREEEYNGPMYFI